MSSRRTSRRLQWLLLLALLALWVTLWQLPLFDEDEGEYAEVAVEMAHRGDYITPTLNGQPFFEKPILAFWLQAPLVSLWGAHPGIFRLPSMLACLLWILAIGRFAQRQWQDEETGDLAALLTATSLSVMVSAHAAAMDGILCLLTTLTLFDIYRVWQQDDRWTNWRIFVWMALGFLAKGPVAVAIPLITSLVFYLLHGEGRRWFHHAFHRWGWLTFCLIALPWYGLQYHRMGTHFIDDFVLRENLGRLTGSLQGHGGSLFYYFPVLLILAWPHTPLLFRGLQQTLSHRITPLNQFLLLWFLTVFVLFSVAHTKLPHYLLVGLPPLVLFMAHHRHALRSWISLAVPGMIMLLVGAITPRYLQYLSQTLANPYQKALVAQGQNLWTILWWERWGTLALLTVLIVAYIRSHWYQADHRAWLLGLNGILGTCWIVGLFLPLAAQLQQAPVLQLAAIARNHNGPIVADNRMPSFAVALGHPTINRPPRSGDWVFLRADYLHNLPPYETIQQIGGLYLVRIP